MKRNGPRRRDSRRMSSTRRFALRRLASAVAATSLASGAVSAHGEIEEIVVTATKDAESMQDVSLAVLALDLQPPEEQHIDVFADYVRNLPNVTAGGRGPGQNEAYIRGLAVDPVNVSIAEANGTTPNVAMYLDEQPASAGGRNLDIYLTDIARVEVLPGPQGTLYGASSQAGTIRLITNKPQVDRFELGFEASLALTRHGKASNSAEAVMNLPIVKGRMAARLAIFNDQRGGYIDNLPGALVPDAALNPSLPNPNGVVFTPLGEPADSHEFADGTFAEPGRAYPVRHAPARNDALVKEDFNDSGYRGFRLGTTYLFRDDWQFTVQHHQQTLEADGVFDYDPTVGDLEVVRFADDALEDTFGQTAWTVEGRIGQLKALYAGAYLQRDIDQVYDYSEYVNVGGYIPGYLCEYNTPGYHGGGGVGYVFDPTLSGDPGVIECVNPAGWTDIANADSRWSHEFRVSGDLGRVSLIGGVFHQEAVVEHVGDFHYGDPSWNALDPSRVIRGKANNPNVRAPTVQFTNDITRSTDEVAVFGEVAWHMTDALTVAVGARGYDLEVGFEGFSAFRYGGRPVPNLADEPGVTVRPNAVGGRDYAANLGDFQPLAASDVIGKVTVSWQWSDNVLLYATSSQGYRPPGFNRAAAAGVATAQGVAARANDGPGGFPDYFIPVTYRSDEVFNIEFGWKALLSDSRLRLNGSVYRMDWNDIQVSHFDSQNISIFTIVDNAGDARITGLEMDMEWRPTENFTLHASAAWNDTELVRVNPTFDFVVADVGSALPLTPEYQTIVRARYEWSFGDGRAFWQLTANHAGRSFNSLVDVPGSDPRQEQDPYFLVDAAVGYRGETVLRDRENYVWSGWGVELFVRNATDERAQLHVNRQDFRERVTTNRPFTVGVRITYDVL